jgi:hypothetical protein
VAEGWDNFAVNFASKPMTAMRYLHVMRTAKFMGRAAVCAARELRMQGRLRAALRLACLWAIVGASLPCAAGASQDVAALLSEPARQWAVDCANNELLVIQHPGSYLRYRFHEVSEKGDRVRDQVETPEGTVARLIARDGRPLTADRRGCG